MAKRNVKRQVCIKLPSGALFTKVPAYAIRDEPEVSKGPDALLTELAKMASFKGEPGDDYYRGSVADMVLYVAENGHENVVMKFFRDGKWFKTMDVRGVRLR